MGHKVADADRSRKKLWALLVHEQFAMSLHLFVFQYYTCGHCYVHLVLLKVRPLICCRSVVQRLDVFHTLLVLYIYIYMYIISIIYIYISIIYIYIYIWLYAFQKMSCIYIKLKDIHKIVIFRLFTNLLRTNLNKKCKSIYVIRTVTR